ncbi:folylpolyglutamate synthase/dihydrofolate synthase family protein [uncultured Bartonella sp.]|uniref:bifunctional folylpolyglutamate synthase/dihydrofolate synthase n=1 Tax=uncultured Bartonella sp. TaxID=104108 RepID=UPI0026041682|nr:folylpolyglutamate synthase/dihydrofolate synthase family protein [uncultured Bartonella sp.]
MTENQVETLINSLLKRYPKGFDLSLQRITRLLQELGNPQLKLPPVIHIAGTNGKGSAAAICQALLESAGYRVHVHTSPHLVHWNERYRIGAKSKSKLVDNNSLADAIERVTKANRDEPITVFELLTAVAFLLFSEHPADAVILEVGLGGRFDATNVIDKPAVSLIMPISLDHVAMLGNTVEKIAFEKGGIIKEGVPLVIGKQDSDGAIEVLTRIAKTRHAPFVVYGQNYHAYEDHGHMVFQNENGLKDLPLPSLRGDHQISNSAAAIEAVLQAGFKISDQDIAKAMGNIVWPARMQRIKQGILIDSLPKTVTVFLDGGHNPAGAKVIAQEIRHWKEKGVGPVTMVAGMINTKDSLGYFKQLNGLIDKVYCVPVLSSDNGVPPQQLTKVARSAGIDAEAMLSIEDALQKIAETTPERTVLIAGSLYMAGDFLKENGTPPQ